MEGKKRDKWMDTRQAGRIGVSIERKKIGRLITDQID